MAPDIHVLQLVGDPVGGIRRHVHALLFGLSARGLRQSYAYSTAASDQVFRKELPLLEAGLGGRLLPLKISKKPSPGDFANLAALRRYVRANGVTIVHGHGAKGGAYARLLALLCGVKAVYTPHGGAVHDMFGKAEGLAYTLAEKAFLPLTDRFVFESAYSARAYEKKIGRPGRWTVNHNGIEPPPESPPARPFPARGEAVNIGVFAMLRGQKGQLYAVRAAAELARARSGVLLHLFGEGPDRAALEAEAARLGASGVVRFRGETEAPLERMREMDIVLIPSLFESFGYAAIEAFSLSRPVVAARTGGLPEIISDGEDGLLAEPGSGEALAAALRRLMDEDGLAARLAAKGRRKAAADFSLERMLAGIAGVYGEVAA